MLVRMNEFTRHPPELLERERAACDRVLASGWWILGREVTEFEEAWAKWVGASAAVGCANGLDAIELALRGLGIGPGDEVISTPMTAFATILGIIRAGATPVLADVDASNAMLSPASVKRCISPRTRAIVLVHLYGCIGPVEELLSVARQHDLYMIEDCAQAHGAKIGGRSAGSFGEAAAWSFYPTKNLGAVGDAGALTTSTDNLAKTVRALRNYGQTERYHHPLLGLNSRLDEMQAALLRERLRYLDDWVEARRRVAERYFSELCNPNIRLMQGPNERSRHAFHLFVVRCQARNELQRHLLRCGVESLIHYPIPVHLQEQCRGMGHDPLGLSESEAHANECLSLPCHPNLTADEVDQVIAAVNNFEV